MGVFEILSPGGIAHFRVETHQVGKTGKNPFQRISVSVPGGDAASLVVIDARRLPAPGFRRSEIPGLFNLPGHGFIDFSQFFKGFFQVFLIQRLAVPSVFILNLGDSLSLDGSRDNHHRLSGNMAALFVGLKDLGKGVAVFDHNGFPSEGRDALFISVQISSIHGFPPLAQTIDVDDAHEIIQLIMGGQLDGLPLRSLRHFAVP